MLVELAAGVSLLIWVYLILFRGMFWRIREDRRVMPAPATRRVAIVVPARNEAETIGPCVASLAAQTFQGSFHIFVVDDHSSDGTAEIGGQFASADLLTVTAAPPLCAGWTGKLWAVEAGIRQAASFQPDYVLFSDADIVHSPTGLVRLVACAEAGGYDLVSWMVKLRCETWAEKSLIPAFLFFFFMLYPPAWTEDARRRTAGAAGGCVLLRWEALRRIGGMEAIRGELIDDCALAKAVKSTGGRISLGVTTGTQSSRGYATFGEIGRMISRTAFWQLKHSVALLAGTVAGMCVTYMVPPLVLLGAKPPAMAAGAVAWALMSGSFIPSLRLYGLSPLWAPALPLMALFYTGATIHSAIRYWTGRGGEWKGRAQDVRR